MRVIVMRGIPGSGKTTLAKRIVEQAVRRRAWSEDNVKVYSADNFFVGLDGVYRFDAKQLGAAHQQCLRMFANDLVAEYHDPHEGALLVVDNTNTSVAEMAPYAQLALAFEAELLVVTVDCDRLVAFGRQTHGVPEGHHFKMDERLRRAQLPKSWPHRIYHDGELLP